MDPLDQSEDKLLERYKDKVIVRGEFSTLLNGSTSYVIIDLVCADQKEAEEILEARCRTYNNLRILYLK